MGGRLAQVTQLSRRFCDVLQEWWIQHSRDDREGNQLWNGFVGTLCFYETHEEFIEFVFVEWTQEVLQEVLAQWADGFAETVVEKISSTAWSRISRCRIWESNLDEQFSFQDCEL